MSNSSSIHNTVTFTCLGNAQQLLCLLKTTTTFVVFVSRTHLYLHSTVQRSYLFEQNQAESPGDRSVATHGHKGTCLHPRQAVIHLPSLFLLPCSLAFTLSPGRSSGGGGGSCGGGCGGRGLGTGRHTVSIPALFDWRARCIAGGGLDMHGQSSTHTYTYHQTDGRTDRWRYVEGECARKFCKLLCTKR